MRIATNRLGRHRRLGQPVDPCHDGAVHTDSRQDLKRLADLYEGILEIIREHGPGEAAVEETFVNKIGFDAQTRSSRGDRLLVPAREGLIVAEYPPNKVKKTVVGPGHAGKEQFK